PIATRPASHSMFLNRRAALRNRTQGPALRESVPPRLRWGTAMSCIVLARVPDALPAMQLRPWSILLTVLLLIPSAAQPASAGDNAFAKSGVAAVYSYKGGKTA